MFKLLLVLLVSISFASPALAADPIVAADHGSASTAEPTVTINAGSGAVVVLPPKAADLPNPAEHPVAAWDDAKAAKKTGWPLFVFACLVMLGKALAYGREKLKSWPVVGKAAAWLSVGKRAMLVAGFGTVGAAGYDVLIAGGSLVAALFAAGVAVAGALHSTTKGA